MIIIKTQKIVLKYMGIVTKKGAKNTHPLDYKWIRWNVTTYWLFMFIPIYISKDLKEVL